MKNSIWLATLFFSLATGAHAQTGRGFGFEQVWRLVKQNSADVTAAEHEAQSAKIAESRASRHWYPRLYADVRAFSTNDPAQSFMALLGQRKIEAADFAPDALNHPPANFYQRGTLGFDLPLFEGGTKVAQASAARSVAMARTHERDAVLRGQYASTASAYATLLVLADQREQLDDLRQGVERVLSRYSVGARANPVGYSGLLGLKGLRNRIAGLLAENAAQASALRERVRLVARELPADWAPRHGRARAFLAARLKPTNDGTSPAVLAARSAADALDKSRQAERARLLPRAGLFAEGYAYGGSRDTAAAYSAGAYLQWDLFSAPNFGASEQARHAAAAAQSRAEAEDRRARYSHSGAMTSIEALERTLALMDESAKLLEEQTATARNLFRNGSINALQLVEVLSRRADLLVNRTDAEIRLSESRATAFLNSGAPYEN